MKLNEILSSDNNSEILIEMPHEEALVAQRVLSSVFKKYLKLTFDMSQHMKNRVLDKGEKGRKEHGEYAKAKDHHREDDVTKEELFSLFNKFIKHKKYRGKLLGAKQFGREVEGIIRDGDSNVNVTFKVAFQDKTDFPIFRIITIMRKKNYKPLKTSDMVFDV